MTAEPPGARVAALGRELVRVHDALREELAALRDAASGERWADPGRSLAVHCVRFCSALTRHHTAEDRRAFPALAAQDPALAPLIEKLEQDHRMIGGIVARVEEIADRLAEVGGGDARLLGELDGLAAILDSHFAFEERRIARALDELGGSPSDVLGLEPAFFNRSVDQAES